MGVLEDIKKSFGDSDSSGDNTFGQTSSDGDLGSSGPGSDDLGSGDDLGSSGGLGNEGPESGLQDQQRPQDSNPQENLSGNAGNQQKIDSGIGGRQDQSSPRDTEGRRGSTPNAQAGRPQEGDSSPQLSQDTRRKMENAGLSDGRNDNRSQGSRGGNVQDDIEELKRQNEQIIGLLEDIVDEMRGGRRR